MLVQYEQSTIRHAVDRLTRIADELNSEHALEVLAARNQLRELITEPQHTDAEARRILLAAGISPAF